MSSFRQRRSWCPCASPSPRTAPFDYADIGIIEGTCPSCSILKMGKSHKMSLQGRKCAPKNKPRKNRTKLAWDHPGLHKLFRCQIGCRCGNIFQHTAGRVGGGVRGGWTNPKPMGICPGVGGIQESANSQIDTLGSGPNYRQSWPRSNPVPKETWALYLRLGVIIIMRQATV